MSSAPPGAPAARKRALRSQARRLRAGLAAAERVERGRRVEALLLDLPELAAAHGVALYAALPDEVPLEGMGLHLGRRGCRIAYPRIQGPGLALHWVGEAEELVPGPWGVLEPDASAPLARADALEVIVLPGLMFDRRGLRLGRGGGHYDRLLPLVPRSVATIGVCLAEALVEELPAEPHDVPVGCVVTDREVLRIS